jgi:putative (di)nucleoside polyphosphate hydrolase
MGPCAALPHPARERESLYAMTDRPDRETLPYRDCVGVAVFNANGNVLVGHRKSEGDPDQSAAHGFAWQLPQGGIDKGEDPLRAALRELYEETSIASVSLLAEAPEWIYYDLPDELLGVAFKGKYRGQRQRWFAFAFTGKDSEIDVLAPGGGKHEAEFNAWRWEKLSRVPGLIVPFKRPAYEQVVEAFADIPQRFTHV